MLQTCPPLRVAGNVTPTDDEDFSGSRAIHAEAAVKLRSLMDLYCHALPLLRRCVLASRPDWASANVSTPRSTTNASVSGVERPGGQLVQAQQGAVVAGALASGTDERHLEGEGNSRVLLTLAVVRSTDGEHVHVHVEVDEGAREEAGGKGAGTEGGA